MTSSFNHSECYVVKDRLDVEKKLVHSENLLGRSPYKMPLVKVFDFSKI